jgi:hypothetical protein
MGEPVLLPHGWRTKYNGSSVEWNITFGSERRPSFNCESVQENAYRLRFATAAHLGADVSCITGERYRTDKFVIDQYFEKRPGQSNHTGINNRSGSQLNLTFKNLGESIICHVILHYEQIMNLSAAGVEVLD